MSQDKKPQSKMKETAPTRLKQLMETGGGFSGFPWPDHYCDFDIRIKRDGSWHYQDSPIDRIKLCQLFATVLQRDKDGDFWLVTPGEKGRIEVEDAPFVAVEMTVEGSGREQKLGFRTNLDHWVALDENHTLRIEEDLDTGTPSPYIHVRDGLEALIGRAVFFDLANLAEEGPAEEGEENGQTILGVWSHGSFFPLGSV
ncbi:DUF1285 domain-containing protein [Aestuariispira insulae]|uniref:DUF1285 domain-containing protein n=1 Tax=Aestuariispira insulae TaxID=1461337 RepID=A0A3D9HEX8_9PROT|nr:DUF1285 domain-containing protein [Aestuariispira insulae]RED48023.1 hypothetical protein DFP90_10840 [Aestuariispira insulae]